MSVKEIFDFRIPKLLLERRESWSVPWNLPGDECDNTIWVRVINKSSFYSRFDLGPNSSASKSFSSDCKKAGVKHICFFPQGDWDPCLRSIVRPQWASGSPKKAKLDQVYHDRALGHVTVLNWDNVLTDGKTMLDEKLGSGRPQTRSGPAKIVLAPSKAFVFSLTDCRCLAFETVRIYPSWLRAQRRNMCRVSLKWAWSRNIGFDYIGGEHNRSENERERR
jgi:hypothetical protein